MDDGKRFYERPVFWPRLFGGIFIFVFIIAFRSEILLLVRLIRTVIQSLLFLPVTSLPPDTPTKLLVLVVNLIIYLSVYYLVLKWVSLFVLPVRDSNERRRVFERLTEYDVGLHGPAVFVKNGEKISRKEEDINKEGMKGRFNSLAFVDLASAIVLESRTLPPIINLKKASASKTEQTAPIRVLGPGIAFLRSGERIRGCVDLRKQYRVIKDVHGFTSDGIELTTNVNVIFTLGQPPDVLMVFEAEDQALRVLMVDQTSKKISISDNIDERDAEEIRANIQNQKPNRAAIPAIENLYTSRPPYRYDDEHIISAVLSQPRNTKDGKLEKWTDLPARVAVSILLDELSRLSYDELYSLDRPETVLYLHQTFKPVFNRKVRDLGVLSYQFLQRKNGKIPGNGDLFNPDEYVFWDIMELQNPKPIRDRGIKVLDAGFSDFKPIDNTIPEQRFDYWRASWQGKTEFMNARFDLEVMRKMNHARANAQREIIYNLSQIYKLPGYSQEAMAIRIFQALESAAANPATNRLLPRDTVDMLRNFQRLLFTQGGNGLSPDDASPEQERRDL